MEQSDIKTLTVPEVEIQIRLRGCKGGCASHANHSPYIYKLISTLFSFMIIDIIHIFLYVSYIQYYILYSRPQRLVL